MKKRKPGTLLLAPCCAATLGTAHGVGALPPAWSVTPETVLDAPTYTEGPAFADEALFVSEPKAGRVTRHGPDGAESVFLDSDLGDGRFATGHNGHATLDDGTHVVLTRPYVVWTDPDGEVLDALGEHAGRAFAFPNDLALDGAGGFWFTDSGSRTEPTGALYHVDATRTARRLADGLAFPNGVLLVGDTLHVSQSQANDVLAFDVGSGGALSNRRVLIALPPEGLDDAKAAPDGMCLGPDGTVLGGTLFVAHNGTGRVRAVSPAGELLASYRTGLLTNSNCAFGPDGALYVTGSIGLETTPGAVVRLELLPTDDPTNNPTDEEGSR